MGKLTEATKDLIKRVMVAIVNGESDDANNYAMAMSFAKVLNAEAEEIDEILRRQEELAAKNEEILNALKGRKNN